MNLMFCILHASGNWNWEHNDKIRGSFAQINQCGNRKNMPTPSVLSDQFTWGLFYILYLYCCRYKISHFSQWQIQFSFHPSYMFAGRRAMWHHFAVAISLRLEVGDLCSALSSVEGLIPQSIAQLSSVPNWIEFKFNWIRAMSLRLNGL